MRAPASLRRLPLVGRWRIAGLCDVFQQRSLRRPSRGAAAKLAARARPRSPVERDDLAVHHEFALPCLAGASRTSVWVPVRCIVVRCSSRHLAAILLRDAELTVELTLEQPLAVDIATA